MPKLNARACYITGIGLCVILLLVFPKWTIDDAYITFRYAANLAQHGELTWNVGEFPIEGYTGVALPVLLALLMRLDVPPDTASKALGALSMLMTAGMLVELLNRLEVAAGIRAAIMLLYVGAPFLYTNALSGLETMLFTGIVLASLLILLGCLQAQRPRGRWEVLCLASVLAASFIRPEGVALAGLCILALARDNITGLKKPDWAFVLRVTLVYILPGAIYFMWRLSYYQQFFPNTFYAKAYPQVNVGALLDFGKFLLRYLALPVLIGLVLVGQNLKDSGDLKRKWARLADRRFPAVFGVSLGFVLILLVQYSRSSLLMNHSYRFFVPFYPIFLVWIGVLLHLGHDTLVYIQSSRLKYYLVAGFIVILVLGQIAIYAQRLRTEVRFTSAYRQLLAEEHEQVGNFLRDVIPSTEWLIVYQDAGVIPFVAGLKTVDFGRLNDPYLARSQSLSIDAIVDYFYSFEAGAIVFTSRNYDEVELGAEAAAITRDPRFDQYTLVRQYRSPTWEATYREPYYELVFLRRDLVRP